MNCIFMIGRTGLKETELLSLPTQNKFWIYLSDIPGRSFIYYEWFDQETGLNHLFNKQI